MADIPAEVLSKLCNDACITQVKQYRDHNIELVASIDTLKNCKRGYQRAMESLEDQVKAYIKNESKYSDEIILAKRETKKANERANGLELENQELKNEISKIKISLKGFQNATETVEKIVKGQMDGKMTGGIGYNEVKPPFNHNYIPPKVEVDTNIKHGFECEPRIVDNIKANKVVDDTNDVKLKGKVESKTPKTKPYMSYFHASTSKGNGQSSFNKRTPSPPKKFNNQTSWLNQPKVSPKHFNNHVHNCQCTCKTNKYNQTMVIGNQRNWNHHKGQRNGPSFSKKEPRECYVCGKVGHIARDCYHNIHRGNNQRVGMYKTINTAKNVKSNTSSSNSQKSNSAGESSTNSTPSYGRTQQRFVKPENIKSKPNGDSTDKGKLSAETGSEKSVNDGSVKSDTGSSEFDSAGSVNSTSSNTSTARTNSNVPNASTHYVKRVDYFNAEGKPKTTMAWVPKRN